jgi:hypothetical protein
MRYELLLKYLDLVPTYVCFVEDQVTLELFQSEAVGCVSKGTGLS